MVGDRTGRIARPNHGLRAMTSRVAHNDRLGVTVKPALLIPVRRAVGPRFSVLALRPTANLF